MKKARLVIGLGNGDEGKGSVIDYLTRQTGSKLIVRFNGGSQAAHNVVDDRGIHHCFSQFGSGSLVPGVETYLSRFMFVNPLNILAEAEVLAKKVSGNPLLGLMVDGRCPIITPFHITINLIKELCAGDQRKGSCGKGVGEAVHDFQNMGEMMLYADDLGDLSSTYSKLNFIRLRKLDLVEQLIDKHPNLRKLIGHRALKNLESKTYLEALAEAYQFFALTSGVRILPSSELSRLLVENDSIFEGAQGVLLDAEYGFWPHVTPTKTTFANALTLLEEAGFTGEVEKIGVLRAYATRHGPGSFPSRDERLEKMIPEAHNSFNEWQRDFRVGWFDLPLTKYALKACGGVDYLAITCLDRLRKIDLIKVLASYGFLKSDRLRADGLLNDYFSGPRFLAKTNRYRQERLGKLISRAYHIFSAVGFEDYVPWLEKKLDCKARLLSFGSKSLDKKFI